MDTEKLVKLAQLRQHADDSKQKMQTILDAVKNSFDYAYNEDQLRASLDEISKLENEIRNEAADEYLKTAVKTLPGVTIKIMKSYVCINEDAARKYALEQDQTLMIVDWKSFAQNAKKLIGTKYEFPFYKEELRISPQIKSDLSEFLPANLTH